MKKLLIGSLVLAVGFLAFNIFAEEVWTQTYPQYTLLNAVTSTGIGSEVDTGKMFGKWHCTVTLGGTAPTSVSVSVLFSDKSGVYDTSGLGIPAQTVTASPTKLQITSYYGRYIKGNYISKVGGDGTTAVTLSCTPVAF
jgi:hypothetical protein